MKRSLFVIAAALLMVAGTQYVSGTQAKKGSPAKAAKGQAHDDQSALKDELIKMERASWDAWKARDGSYFAHFLSDDHVEMGGGGPSSKKDVVEFVGSPVCVVESWSADKFQFTRLNSETALLTYYAEQKTQCNGKPVPSPAWVTSLYVHRDGRWQNAVYQQTPKS